MTYRVLPEHLTAYADSAEKYFQKSYGLKNIKKESEIHPTIDFCPTFHGQNHEKQIVCVEVSDSAFPMELSAFVLRCKNNGIPVLLYVVVPDITLTIPPKDIAHARESGVSVVLIDLNSNAQVLQGPPLALSLSGVRSPKLSEFPSKYRQSIAQAHETFRQGNPAKACASIYDEIEALTRKLAIKAAKVNGGLKKPGNMNFEKDPWNSVLEFLKTNLDSKVLNCPDLKPVLFNRLIGLTEYRNDTGHKPKNLEQLISRDVQLRTRMESAIDELRNLTAATSKLKL